ncbi:MAG: glycoside hydrolase family 97 catalytic domain-containing protein, partial [Phycisphaerales bacterium]
RDRWGLLTEAGLEPSYCACRLEQKAPGGVYRLRFPDEGEGNHTGTVEPSWTLPWATPWRVVMVAESLSKIVESTLVTNLSPPSIVRDTSWIKPGRASWSWLSDHDSPQDFDKLRKFVDLAAEMGWEYSLVDANWTVMKNGTIHDLIEYAASKGVGLLLWYNSGGVHNYVSEKPRGLMFSRQIRRKEFKLLQQWGVKGVKVDFFQSDKQNIIQLYHDILKDAADFKIMVNFHGCTLPRGWSRTYPHLMSMESMRGAECYSFDRAFTAKAPTHNTTLPFTRNVVGPMDYTPVLFVDNVYRHLTSYAHELALGIIFESGWLHFADRVGAYLDLPEAPKDFLRNVPVAWDETRCLAGEPAKYIVLARRSGTQWYIGGINGEKAPRSVEIVLNFADEGSYEMTMLDDGNGPRSFSSRTRSIRGGDTVTARMGEYGGFVGILFTAE